MHEVELNRMAEAFLTGTLADRQQVRIRLASEPISSGAKWLAAVLVLLTAGFLSQVNRGLAGGWEAAMWNFGGLVVVVAAVVCCRRSRMTVRHLLVEFAERRPGSPALDIFRDKNGEVSDKQLQKFAGE